MKGKVISLAVYKQNKWSKYSLKELLRLMARRNFTKEEYKILQEVILIKMQENPTYLKKLEGLSQKFLGENLIDNEEKT
jgi:hypothetical protein